MHRGPNQATARNNRAAGQERASAQGCRRRLPAPGIGSRGVVRCVMPSPCIFVRWGGREPVESLESAGRVTLDP